MLPPEDSESDLPESAPIPGDFQMKETGHASYDMEQTEDPFLEAEEAENGLEDWKAEMRREFEVWLADIDSIPEIDPEDEEPETPDLFAFYSQWAAANAEARKSNRRSAEAFSQWGDVLGRFDGDLKMLREQLQQLAAEAPGKGMSRAHCLVLVEMLDRLQRVARAFASPPEVSWWGGGKAWSDAWERQHQALDILLGHFDGLLKKEGLTRIETAGHPFDPTTMTAVAAEVDSTKPDQTIIEELAPGYRLRGELLRPAQVKVSLNKPSTPKA
jgi:molecular chaperone GrpE (heat shock protein)